LSHPFGAGEVGFDGGFEFLDDGKAALNFGYDALVLAGGWQWDHKAF
jgi:hypothetical protein